MLDLRWAIPLSPPTKYVGKPMKGHTKTTYEVIKLSMLNDCSDNETIDYKTLIEKGLQQKKIKAADVLLADASAKDHIKF